MQIDYAGMAGRIRERVAIRKTLAGRWLREMDNLLLDAVRGEPAPLFLHEKQIKRFGGIEFIEGQFPGRKVKVMGRIP